MRGDALCILSKLRAGGTVIKYSLIVFEKRVYDSQQENTSEMVASPIPSSGSSVPQWLCRVFTANTTPHIQSRGVGTTDGGQEVEVSDGRYFFPSLALSLLPNICRSSCSRGMSAYRDAAPSFRLLHIAISSIYREELTHSRSL